MIYTPRLKVSLAHTTREQNTAHRCELVCAFCSHVGLLGATWELQAGRNAEGNWVGVCQLCSTEGIVCKNCIGHSAPCIADVTRGLQFHTNSMGKDGEHRAWDENSIHSKQIEDMQIVQAILFARISLICDVVTSCSCSWPSCFCGNKTSSGI